MASTTKRRTTKKSARSSSSKSSASKSDVYDASADELLKFYRDMLLIRRFEEKAGQMYGMGLIGGFCHLYIGQEAVVIGVQSAPQGGRQRHHQLSRSRPHARLRHGPESRDGRADRPQRRHSKGKGGSMHMFSTEKGFFGGHGIVGAQVPLGTGLAFAHQYRDDGGVAVDLFRRRRGQSGPGLRGLQHGRAVEAAGHLRHREQPLRHGHVGRARRRPRSSCRSAA